MTPLHPGPTPDTEARYEALAAAPAPELVTLADRILAPLEDTQVEVLAGPEVGSGPVRLPVPGTASATVVVGHVALTTATVALCGIRGDGVRPGRDPGGAVAAAVCDAEAERDGPLAQAVEALAATSIRSARHTKRRLGAVVESTRVGGQ
ncbi:MAG: phosphonate C-P lyase system protein PhnG [Acidimicrobiia bacterium]